MASEKGDSPRVERPFTQNHCDRDNARIYMYALGERQA
jgi:hypothetical protein